jgi:hypothetical protein
MFNLTEAKAFVAEKLQELKESVLPAKADIKFYAEGEARTYTAAVISSVKTKISDLLDKVQAGEYKPDEFVTREDLTAAVQKNLGLSPDERLFFSDIPAAARGLTVGEAHGFKFIGPDGKESLFFTDPGKEITFTRNVVTNEITAHHGDKAVSVTGIKEGKPDINMKALGL